MDTQRSYFHLFLYVIVVLVSFHLFTSSEGELDEWCAARTTE
jgi:hypothetical protein